MKYLIAIMLPTPINDTIRTLQLKHKPTRWNITVAPHITLLYQGDLFVPERELKEWLHAVAETMSPFPVRLANIKYFTRTSKTVYLTVHTDERLRHLQKALVDIIQPFLIKESPFSRPSEYHPHVTIANRLTAEEFPSVLQALRDQPLDFRFECQSFTLLKRGPRDSEWQEIETFPLRNLAE